VDNPRFVKELVLAGRRCLQDEEGNLWEIYAEEDVSTDQVSSSKLKVVKNKDVIEK
jgi:hypothetical protein